MTVTIRHNRSGDSGNCMFQEQVGGRYGQVFLSPQVGFDPSEEGHDSPKSDEKATPYYYGVTLDRYGIRTEITPYPSLRGVPDDLSGG